MLLEIKDFCFSYPNTHKPSLNHVSLQVNSGDFIVICGSSGSGKSTLIKSLKPELAPHGQKMGEILFDGTPISELDLRKSASEIGFVMQNPHSQIVTDMVWHELAFGLENLGMPTNEIKLRVSEMASFFGIADWFNKKTSEFSGGQLQLLNLASVMAMQPKLLLLDEPTSQLDPISASEFIETLKKLNRDTGLTIVIVEHRLEDIFFVADKVVIMQDGTILHDAPPQFISNMLPCDHPIMLSFPTPMRIHNAVGTTAPAPLTARDGRRFLTENYPNPTIGLQSKPIVDKTAPPVFQIKNVWFRYTKDGDDILKGVSLNAYKGEILSIVGANGAGKSTLLSVMSRTKFPYKGKVILNKKKLSEYKNTELYHNNLAILPQNPQTVFVGDTVSEDLLDICKVMGYSDNSKLSEIIGMLGITHLLNSHPYDLSGGEQQKVAFAKILLLNPQVILLDEPTKGIDAFAKQALGNILKELARNGATIILVTHDIEFSAQISDRCSMFFCGEIITTAPMVEFYSGNSFYTTVANRMSRHLFKNAITCEDVISLCKENS